MRVSSGGMRGSLPGSFPGSLPARNGLPVARPYVTATQRQVLRVLAGQEFALTLGELATLLRGYGGIERIDRAARALAASGMISSRAGDDGTVRMAILDPGRQVLRMRR